MDCFKLIPLTETNLQFTAFHQGMDHYIFEGGGVEVTKCETFLRTLTICMSWSFKHAKLKFKANHPSILTKQAWSIWSIKDISCGKKNTIFLLDTAGKPKRARQPYLMQVANHSTRFGLSCTSSILGRQKIRAQDLVCLAPVT